MWYNYFDDAILLSNSLHVYMSNIRLPFDFSFVPSVSLNIYSYLLKNSFTSKIEISH